MAFVILKNDATAICQMIEGVPLNQIKLDEVDTKISYLSSKCFSSSITTFKDYFANAKMEINAGVKFSFHLKKTIDEIKRIIAQIEAINREPKIKLADLLSGEYQYHKYESVKEARELIVLHRIDVNECIGIRDGDDLLSDAIRDSNEEVVHFLLEMGANPSGTSTIRKKNPIDIVTDDALIRAFEPNMFSGDRKVIEIRCSIAQMLMAYGAKLVLAKCPSYLAAVSVINQKATKEIEEEFPTAKTRFRNSLQVAIDRTVPSFPIEVITIVADYAKSVLANEVICRCIHKTIKLTDYQSELAFEWTKKSKKTKRIKRS